jgi:hypothetical protein
VGGLTGSLALETLPVGVIQIVVVIIITLILDYNYHNGYHSLDANSVSDNVKKFFTAISFNPLRT